jgi:RNA polymerase sigma-70 factor (ECF subfamily)
MDRSPDRVLDEYLVLLCQAGQRAAFAQLAALWTPRLLRHAARLLGATDAARDAVQEAWAAASRGLDRLDDPSRFGPWIYAIATRKCADAIRANARRRKLANEATQSLNGSAYDPTSVQESAIDLGDALKALPADQRAILSLFYGEDLTVDEIAAALKAPAGTIKSRLHHARQSLKRHLEGEGS